MRLHGGVGVCIVLGLLRAAAVACFVGGLGYLGRPLCQLPHWQWRGLLAAAQCH
jgi:hypothetical protein